MSVCSFFASGSRGIAFRASAGPTSVCDGSQPASSDSQLAAERVVDLFGEDLRLCAGREPRRFGEAQQRDELRVGLLRHAWSTIACTARLPSPSAVVFVPAVAHRVAVVEQHEMVRRAAAQQAEPFVAQHQVGEHQHEHARRPPSAWPAAAIA